MASHYILNNDYSFITSTIINGSSPSHPDTASCVRFVSGEDSTAILEGFTLTGGSGTKWPDIHIGGNYREGGAILIELSSPTIKNNIIIDNEAIDKTAPDVTSAGGGAIRCGDGNPYILSNVILENRGLYGGGIVLNFSGGIIKNNIIYQNSGGQDFGGAGIWCYSNGPAPKIIENNTIVYNSSLGSGAYGGRGGALMVWATTIFAQNNIIWGNTQNSGGPIATISGNANITYSDIEGSWSGTGNIDIDPVFADTNFFLTPSSPCVDSGNPDTRYNDPENLNNPGFAQSPSLGGLRNDMGAFGGPFSSIVPGIIITDIHTDIFFPIGNILKQNYPNPFNLLTNIEYSLEKSSNVKINIYNSLGQKIKTLIKEYQGQGNQRIQWNGKNEIGRLVSSGIYFYQFIVDDKVINRSMILLK